MVSVQMPKKNLSRNRRGLLFSPTALPIQCVVDPEVKGNVTRLFRELGGNPRGHKTVKIIKCELIPTLRREGDVSFWRRSLI